MNRKNHIRKNYYKKLLSSSGYKALTIYGRTRVELYAMLVIACNKLNPEAPNKAYDNIIHAFGAIARGKKCNPKAWKKIEDDLAVNED